MLWCRQLLVPSTTRQQHSWPGLTLTLDTRIVVPYIGRLAIHWHGHPTHSTVKKTNRVLNCVYEPLAGVES